MLSAPEDKSLIRVFSAGVNVHGQNNPYAPFIELLAEAGGEQVPQSWREYDFRQEFNRISQICPLLLFIDDLHWVDDELCKKLLALCFDNGRPRLKHAASRLVVEINNFSSIRDLAPENTPSKLPPLPAQIALQTTTPFGADYHPFGRKNRRLSEMWRGFEFSKHFKA